MAEEGLRKSGEILGGGSGGYGRGWRVNFIYTSCAELVKWLTKEK
jgi:hypothetical protein